jgi:hypothetical protein
MNTTPRPDYSFSRGVKVAARAMIELVKTKPLIFIWINVFATWFIGGGALMLFLGSTSILPIVCVVTPLVPFPGHSCLHPSSVSAESLASRARFPG